MLKKFDNRLGFRHIGWQYIVSRSNRPYSQLQQVFRQVVTEYLILPILSLSLSHLAFCVQCGNQAMVPSNRIYNVSQLRI